jgi:gentisate 1,2-dioxygenase
VCALGRTIAANFAFTSVSEADERLQREEDENPATGYEVALHDPEGNPAKLRVTAHQQHLERAERELAQVRRELSSPTITAITSSEISKFA